MKPRKGNWKALVAPPRPLSPAWFLRISDAAPVGAGAERFGSRADLRMANQMVVQIGALEAYTRPSPRFLLDGTSKFLRWRYMASVLLFPWGHTTLVSNHIDQGGSQNMQGQK